ncbi:beta-lactamase family protein [Pedobacter sp. KBS0701]|uniref:serine hydrolase domain-containing protein n=1 Tax=Pedobacter sp. KBS0701 TaxID=2578106 RepID=UPI00110F0B04|nr:serine hydrolase domain-containing protein [Pedobacter sp. KBS0701]QDW24375.1 beta-lactamase family protein [Pedobacter sp. KBS0701]
MKPEFIKAIFLLFLSMLSCATLKSQTKNKYSKEVENKIIQVENHLASWVEIENTPKWNLKERMNFYEIKGLSIAIIKDYKLEWAKGYGWADSAQSRRVTPATLFQAASISKSLNGMGMLKLAQDRNIDLKRDINSYLHSWKFPYDSISKGKKITTLNLLSHTGGINVSGFDGYQKTDSIPDIIQILNGIKPANSDAVKSVFEPDLKYKYSGGGTVISQLIIEDVSGKKYADYMKSNILRPIGMQNSFYTNTTLKSKLKLLATGYNGSHEVMMKYHIYPEQAAAGLWTNPTELSKFVIEVQKSLSSKSNKLLSREMTKLMLTPYLDNSAALGVFIEDKEGTKYFRHGGVNEGFTSLYFGGLEDGNGAVVMCNSTDKTILYEIINSIATVYKWKNFYKPELKKVVKINSSELMKYTGKYTSNDREYIISQVNGDLFLELSGQRWQLYFTSKTNFFMYQAPGINHQFIYENDKIQGFQIKLSGGKNIVLKKTE